jgi:hypothetical protein
VLTVKVYQNDIKCVDFLVVNTGPISTTTMAPSYTLVSHCNCDMPAQVEISAYNHWWNFDMYCPCD